MQTSDLLQAWGRILGGHRPSLSIEITRECPLRCPGCYAYDPAHLGGDITLRQLNDRKGEELIEGILELADRHRPLHLSLVGGDPLVRYRELEIVVPKLLARGIHVQIVTSAFRRLPDAWIGRDHLNISVSIDGLEPEHNARRARHIRTNSEKHPRAFGDRSLHHHRPHDAAARIPRRVSAFLDASS